MRSGGGVGDSERVGQFLVGTSILQKLIENLHLAGRQFSLAIFIFDLDAHRDRIIA